MRFKPRAFSQNSWVQQGCAVLLTSLASEPNPTRHRGLGDNWILVPPLEKEFEAKLLNFAFCAKKLGSWMFLLPREGLGTQSRGSTGEGVLFGCGSRVPPRAQRSRAARWARVLWTFRLQPRAGWKTAPSLLLRSQVPSTNICPGLGVNRHLVIQHDLENPGSSNHMSVDQKSQRSNGKKRTLTQRWFFFFALKLKLLSPGSLPPPLLPSSHLLCPMSDLKGQI